MARTQRVDVPPAPLLAWPGIALACVGNLLYAGATLWSSWFAVLVGTGFCLAGLGWLVVYCWRDNVYAVWLARQERLKQHDHFIDLAG